MASEEAWKGEEWGVTYFLPRKPWPKALALYGSFILGGIGAGMLLEAWINNKVKQDGGVIWEFDK
ncbi:unnamed protein product [Arabis nemorensis]|uniref:Uncharacterized protein n=1 Tax=Arabis nemorensis TaxID=586526 RepID=A0A565CMP3_9BRAS|nr:unnamed protein product [Arabis nemorensis]